jgi:hypothetical protein
MLGRRTFLKEMTGVLGGMFVMQSSTRLCSRVKR